MSNKGKGKGTKGTGKNQATKSQKLPKPDGVLTVLDKKATFGARKGCFELEALLGAKQHVVVGNQTKIRTGIKVKLKAGMFAMLVPSAVMAGKKITMMPPIVMATNDEEIEINLLNQGTFVQEVENGDHIADMFILQGSIKALDIMAPKPEKKEEEGGPGSEQTPK